MLNNKLDELDHCVTAYGENYYERELRFQSQYFPERITELEGGINKISEKSILDLGVGSGYSVRYFANKVKDYTVLEGGESIISKFRNENPDIHIDMIQTLFEEYVPEKQFDIIVMGCILEHVDDPQEILLQYKRFLKKDGKMYLAVPNWEALHKKIAYFAGKIPDMHFLSERDYELGHKRTFNIETFQKLISDAGLNCFGMEGIFLKPIATSQMNEISFDDKIYASLLAIGKEYPELSAIIFAQAGVG